MFKKFCLFSVVLVLAAALFAGCRETTQEHWEPDEVRYTVTFVMRGHTVETQKVRNGDRAATVKPQVEGLRFYAWTNQEGEIVDPTQFFVKADATYTAIAYPELNQHEPFIFLNEEGKLRPDDLLTADDLHKALHALAPEEAVQYFPGLYTGSSKVTLAELTKVMSYFFPMEDVKSAFVGEPTRSNFARGMLKLLGRSTEEKLVLDPEATLPVDLHFNRVDVVAMMESCVAHTNDENGQTWAQMELPSGYAPGFLNIQGWLYYVKEDGYLLKNENLGDLKFDEDGRYTSGDPELDATVAELLHQFAQENPGKDRFGLLRVAYDHCVNDYKYLRKEAYAKGATGWEIEDAKEMFDKQLGNCYNFAAIFWALARGLGYEAYAISGNCTTDVQPHGWVQIEIDGADYFFDPEWHYAYINENRPVKDMFMISMDRISYWSYDWYPI